MAGTVERKNGHSPVSGRNMSKFVSLAGLAGLAFIYKRPQFAVLEVYNPHRF